MKKFYVFLFAMLCASLSFADALKPVAQKISERKSQQATFSNARLFDITNATAQRSIELKNSVSNAIVMDFRQSAAQSILATQPENITFSIPASMGTVMELELYKATIFTPDFSVITSSSGRAANYQGGVHYQGIIKGDNSSVAAISIFNDEVMGMISSPSSGNFVLGKLEHDAQGRHIFYNDKDLHATPGTVCYTANDNETYSDRMLQQPDERVMANCIRIYWEVNYDIFQNKGSVTNATNYVTGLFNQSSVLYTNDAIPVTLSEVFVWNTASPYTATSTSSLLGQFQANRNSFNGDLGNLLGYAGGGGIAAGFSGICNGNLDNSQCYSGISSSYSNVPTFSWSVEVVTHEQGHLMGSRHTHACVWNGNNTAIDGCGPSAGYGYEGSCSGAPIPSGGGTIMSYCHLVSAGINFSMGFGTQPRNVILNNYNNGACLTSCTGNGCGIPYALAASAITLTTATLTWGNIGSATSYNLQYKLTSSGTWTTVSGLTATSYNLSALASGTSYDFEVQAVCAAGSSDYSTVASFSTVAICNDNNESNNTKATATPVVLATNTSGLISPQGDVDYFKFNTTPAKPNIRITLSNLPADYELSLLKSTVLASSNNGGLTTESIVYNTNTKGSYKVKVYGYSGANNANSCYTLKVETSATAFRLSDSDNSSDPNKSLMADDGISVYPNPANHVLNVDFSATENSSVQVVVLDQTGRQVAFRNIENNKPAVTHFEFDMSTFSNGIYFVKVVNADEVITRKVVVTH